MCQVMKSLELDLRKINSKSLDFVLSLKSFKEKVGFLTKKQWTALNTPFKSVTEKLGKSSETQNSAFIIMKDLYTRARKFGKPEKTLNWLKTAKERRKYRGLYSADELRVIFQIDSEITK